MNQYSREVIRWKIQEVALLNLKTYLCKSEIYSGFFRILMYGMRNKIFTAMSGSTNIHTFPKPSVIWSDQFYRIWQTLCGMCSTALCAGEYDQPYTSTKDISTPVEYECRWRITLSCFKIQKNSSVINTFKADFFFFFCRGGTPNIILK